jgi:hypothetical protein
MKKMNPNKKVHVLSQVAEEPPTLEIEGLEGLVVMGQVEALVP